MANEPSYGFQFTPDTESEYRFDPMGYFRALGNAAGILPPPASSDIPGHDGSDYSVNPGSGEVKPMPEEPQSPLDDPKPFLTKAQAKAIEPHHNLLVNLASGFGEDPSKGGHMIAPYSREFHDKIGTSAKHQGIENPMLYNLPVIGNFMRAISPKAQSVLATQNAADKAYEYMLKLKLGEASSGPNTVGEAHQMGMRFPLDQSQLQEGITPPGEFGPGAPVPNPDADLTLPQQIGITGPMMKGLAGGSLVRNPVTGELMSSWQSGAMSGGLNHETAIKALESMPNFPEASRGKIQLPVNEYGLVPQSVYDALATRFAPSNMINPLSGVDRDAFARQVTQEHGFPPMSFAQMLQHPEASKLAPVVDNRLQRYYRTKNENRVDSTADVTREQPVGPAISKYGRLEPNGDIGKPQDNKLTTNQLNDQNYVDLSHMGEEVKGYNNLKIIENSLKKVEGYANELFKTQPGGKNLLKQGIGIKLDNLTEGGKKTNVRGADGKYLTRGQVAKLYNREVASMLEYYGRNLRGLRGAATEGDVDRMKQSFANEWTTEGTKNTMFQDLREFVNDVRKSGQMTLFGRQAFNIKPGTIEDGYKFTGKLGDDPGDATNWQKVK